MVGVCAALLIGLRDEAARWWRLLDVRLVEVVAGSRVPGGLVVVDRQVVVGGAVGLFGEF